MYVAKRQAQRINFAYPFVSNLSVSCCYMLVSWQHFLGGRNVCSLHTLLMYVDINKSKNIK